MTRHIKVVALIILAVGLFHGARRLYSSHMLFSESLHGNQGYASQYKAVLSTYLFIF
jgi:predicted metal-dependent hydrolase